MRLALGTVQFGLNYGIANQHGQTAPDEAQAIVGLARMSGIDTLDTAIAYGDSENRLGEIGITGWQVISKLPAMPPDCRDIFGWAERAVTESLSRLKIKCLYGLLLHRPQQLLESNGASLYDALQQLKAQGLVQKIGVSIYDPAELDSLCNRFQFDLVQAPFNLVDRRLASTGWMTRLKEMNVELHVRSAFLQGLLLMPPSTRPKKFERWDSLWDAYDDWIVESGLTPLQACLRYPLSFPEVGKVVVGVDGENHLKEILRVAQGPLPSVPSVFATNDPELINPGHWMTLS